VRILGIDPGYHRCGFAVVESSDGSVELTGSGTIETKRGEALAVRLHALALELEQLLSRWQPDWLAVEEVYFTRNVKTAIGVAQARGVVLERSAAAGVPVAEYTPTMVKSQLTGNGKADKQQVAFMVARRVSLDEGKRLDDEVDAIAVALCHAMRATIPEEMR
jgi:crossover junction endodeoxyribonuclease RuvC